MFTGERDFLFSDINDAYFQVDLCREISIKAHYGQRRRDTDEPYAAHPRRVAGMVESNYQKCVAFLHDVLEKTNETVESLKDKGVDYSVIQGVEIITHRKNQPYDDYIDYISYYPELVKVKLADMVDNLCGSPTNRQKEKYHKSMLKLLSKL